MTVKANQSGNTMKLAATALLAGVIGSVVTLAVTASLRTQNLRQFEPSTQQDERTATTLLQSDEEPALHGSEQIDTDIAGQVRQLQATLKDAAAERSQLADTLAGLSHKLNSIESDAINYNSQLALGRESLNEDAAQTDIAPPDSTESSQATYAQDRIKDLLLAGIDEPTAREIQDRQDRFQLARLELFDKAEREGWIDSDDFSQQLEQLDEQRLDMREELGDQAYDRYLFELGRNNRVIVASVIGGSAADLAGLRAGDTILSYAGRRVFSTRELQSATRQGARGEYVSVQVSRQNSAISTELPRGPLGITLNAIRREPS